jgi:hypothetical protein
MRQTNAIPRYNSLWTESKILATQARLWETDAGYERIVALVGLRRDDFRNRVRTYTTKYNSFGEWMPPPGYLDENASFGVDGGVKKSHHLTNTRSLIFRPVGGVGLYYNASDILVANNSATKDFMGRPMADSTGMSWS